MTTCEDTGRAAAQGDERRRIGQWMNISLFLIALGMCVVSAVGASTLYLATPLLGIASIIIAVVTRSWWTSILGLLELVMPLALIFLGMYLEYLEQAG